MHVIFFQSQAEIPPRQVLKGVRFLRRVWLHQL